MIEGMCGCSAHRGLMYNIPEISMPPRCISLKSGLVLSGSGIMRYSSDIELPIPQIICLLAIYVDRNFDYANSDSSVWTPSVSVIGGVFQYNGIFQLQLQYTSSP